MAPSMASLRNSSRTASALEWSAFTVALLAIVRNTCLTRLERRRSESNVVVLHGVIQSIEPPRHPALVSLAPPQDQAMIAEEERKRVHTAIAALPLQFREVLVLREFNELSYREIAEVMGTPVGTVMSRLARARERMRLLLTEGAAGEERANHHD